MHNQNPKWLTRLFMAVEIGFTIGVVLSVLVWLFVLPVLGIRCWVTRH